MRDGGDCPICDEEVEKIGKRTVAAEGGKTRKVNEFLCLGCHFQGTAREFRQKSHEVIDDRIAFYYCQEFHLGLFYREQQPQTDPIQSETVDIPCLDDREVQIELMGVGTIGQEALANRIGSDAPVFPVDLWHDPGCIDPHVSNTVTEELYGKWKEFVDGAKRK